MENEHPRLAELVGQHTKGDILAINNGGVYVDSRHVLVGSDRLRYRPLPEATIAPTIAPRMSILHTQAGSTKATNDQAWNWANRPEVVGEAHFYGPEMDGGAMLQAMPLNRRADSQYKANRFQLPNGDPTWWGAVSFETQDAGSASLNATQWTWDQIGTLCAALTAIHFTYRMRCTPCGWYLDGGISQHNAFPNDWSLTAHSCPGTARTRQMDGIRHEVAARLAKIYTDCLEECPA